LETLDSIYVFQILFLYSYSMYTTFFVQHYLFVSKVNKVHLENRVQSKLCVCFKYNSLL
jgi:hypothetical protein